MVSSCRTNTIVSEEYAFMTFETECLGIELDGSQTLRAWGKGKDKADGTGGDAAVHGQITVPVEQGTGHKGNHHGDDGIDGVAGGAHLQVIILLVHQFQIVLQRHIGNAVEHGGHAVHDPSGCDPDVGSAKGDGKRRKQQQQGADPCRSGIADAVDQPQHGELQQDAGYGGNGGQRNDLRPGHIKIAQNLGRNGRGCAAGHNAADIANHVIADGADPFGIAQQRNGFLCSGDFPGSHGMEGFLIRSGHSHADDIENDTHQNDRQQDQKGHKHGTGGHNHIRQQGDGAGDQNCDQKNGNDPAGRLVPLAFECGGIGFRHGKIPRNF